MYVPGPQKGLGGLTSKEPSLILAEYVAHPYSKKSNAKRIAHRQIELILILGKPTNKNYINIHLFIQCFSTNIRQSPFLGNAQRLLR